MKTEELNTLRTELGQLVRQYTENCEVDMDRTSIKQIQDTLHAYADGLEEILDDIQQAELGLRTDLISFLIGYFSKNGHIIYRVHVDEKPLGFSIEVDVPWHNEFFQELENAMVQEQSGKLDRAWHCYKKEIDETYSVMTFRHME